MTKAMAWIGITMAILTTIASDAPALTPAPGQSINFTTSPPAPGVPLNAYSGEIEVSGATLFEDFFRFPTSTNDFIDADGDGCRGFNPGGGCPAVDTLAPLLVSTVTLNTFWGFTYRGVGSVNGLTEFVSAQLLGTTPTALSANRSLFNLFVYVNAGAYQWGGTFCNPSGTPFCPDATYPVTAAVLDVPTGWAVVNGNGANAIWNLKPFQDGYGQNPVLSNTGWNSVLASLTRGALSLNQNFAAPDANTVYDTPVSWVPISIAVNRGVGRSDIRFTELQHLFVSGRLPNGENLVGATRSAGSGTRNGCMNSLSIDPSWGRGDNVGNEFTTNNPSWLGPIHQPSNCEGSGLIEQVVQWNRLAIGYTGLGGPGRAAADRFAGLYEVMNTCKDIDGDGDGFPDSDCTPSAAHLDDGAGDVSAANNGFVRPTIDTVLDNDDPRTGYQIGGTESFATRGDPLAMSFDFNQDGDSLDAFEQPEPGHAGNPGVTLSPPTAAYLKNIVESIKNFTSVPADPNNQASPGEFLAAKFFPFASVDALPKLSLPVLPGKFIDQVPPAFSQTLQDYVRINNDIAIAGANPVGAFGAVNTAGRVPRRTKSGDPGGIVYTYAGGGSGKYSDGSTDGSYYYYDAPAGTLRSVNDTKLLNQRNRVSGDFNYDMYRDVADIALMVQAMFNPRAFQKGIDAAGDPNKNGDLLINAAIPEVLADFDGDGNFDKEDLRYFMDGLGMYPTYAGSLNRKEAAIAIDAAIVANAPAQDYLGTPVADPRAWLPWASTKQFMVVPPATAGGDPKWELPPHVNSAPFLATGKPYKNGDFRGDVAGTTVLNGPGNRLSWLSASLVRSAPTPGAAPTGWDGKVDAKDIDYVVQNILKVVGPATWSDLNNAVKIDLSCDMNGDLVVDCLDVRELVEVILETHFGDRNLDGVVDAADEPAGPFPRPGGWADGDFNCDGMVTTADHDIWAAASVHPLHAIAWRSIRSHSGIGDLPIVLNATATGNAAATAGGPNIETRGTNTTGGVGIARVQVDFDGTAAAPNATQITVTGYTTTYPGGTPTLGSLVGYSAATAVMIDADTMEMTFSPPLPDQSCFRITLGTNVIAQTVTGDVDVMVRGLNGDANLSGTLTNSDVLLTKSKFVGTPPNGPPADAVNQIYDYNLSGVINNSDVLYCKAQLIAQAFTRSALCP